MGYRTGYYVWEFLTKQGMLRPKSEGCPRIGRASSFVRNTNCFIPDQVQPSYPHIHMTPGWILSLLGPQEPLCCGLTTSPSLVMAQLWLFWGSSASSTCPSKFFLR